MCYLSRVLGSICIDNNIIHIQFTGKCDTSERDQ